MNYPLHHTINLKVILAVPDGEMIHDVIEDLLENFQQEKILDVRVTKGMVDKEDCNIESL